MELHRVFHSTIAVFKTLMQMTEPTVLISTLNERFEKLFMAILFISKIFFQKPF